ncbi:hypothetical protein LCGC14_1031950 [marine sediment metagenome]|uniref:Uncharacterized protein n=1 Tax=marine sediment metagenome TaxID=412755 RepID=A0A0F9MUD4_9ZZZZ
MNDKDFKWKHCERKKGYNHIKNAKNIIKIMKKSGMIINNCNIYKCKYCHKYHIGHKKKE